MIVEQHIDDATALAYDWTECGGRLGLSLQDENSLSSHETDRPLLRSAVISSVDDRGLAPSARKGMLSFSKERRQRRENVSSHSASLDARDDCDSRMHIPPVSREQGGGKELRASIDVAITTSIPESQTFKTPVTPEYQRIKTPTEIMLEDTTAARLKERIRTMSRLPVFGAVSGTHQEQEVPVFKNFTERQPRNSPKPVVRKIHRKILSAFSKCDNEAKRKQTNYRKDTDNKKNDGKSIIPRSDVNQGSIQERKPMTIASEGMPSKKSTYPRRRITPKAISLHDLQARFHAKCQLHDELDQLVKVKSMPTLSTPIITLRDPLGEPLSPFVEDDDEDSEIQSDVSSAIDVTDSSSRSLKLLYYLRCDYKSPNQNPLSGTVLNKDDSCQSSTFGDLESEHSTDLEGMFPENPEMEYIEKVDDDVSLNNGKGDGRPIHITHTSTVFEGIEENSKLNLPSHMEPEGDNQSTTIFGGLEAPEEGPYGSSACFGDFEEHEIKEVNPCSPVLAGLETAATPFVPMFDEGLLGARFDEGDDKEDWVSFGPFYEEQASPISATTSPIEVEAKTPLAASKAVMTFIIDVVGATTEIKESIIQMNSGDVSELTDFDFPDISKASHPLDKETQEKLTTCDVIRLSKERLLAKKKLKKVQQALLQSEGLHSIDSLRDKAKNATPGGSLPGLFNRPASTPFQNKQQDESTSGTIQWPTRSVLRKSSFCGSHHNETVPLGSRMITDNPVALDCSVNTPQRSSQCNDKDPIIMTTEAANTHPVVPRCVKLEEEEEEDDPLLRLHCLTRIAI